MSMRASLIKHYCRFCCCLFLQNRPRLFCCKLVAELAFGANADRPTADDDLGVFDGDRHIGRPS